MKSVHAVAFVAFGCLLMGLGPRDSAEQYPRLVRESMANGNGLFAPPIDMKVDPSSPKLGARVIAVSRVEKWEIQGKTTGEAKVEWVLRFRVEDTPATPMTLVVEEDESFQIIDSTGKKIGRGDKSFYFVEAQRTSVYGADFDLTIRGIESGAKSVSVKGKARVRVGGAPMWCFQDVGREWSKFQFAEKGRSLQNAEVRMTSTGTKTGVELRPSSIDNALEWVALPSDGPTRYVTPSRRWIEADVIKCEFDQPSHQRESMRYVIRDPVSDHAVQIDAADIPLPQN